MNITPIPTNIQIQMPRNERQSALKIKEVMPEAEFTGLSSNVRVDGSGAKWFMNNDPYTKAFGKYDAYAYEWTVSTGEDYRSSYIKNHDTENMGFEDFLSYVRENGLDKELNSLAIKSDMVGTNSSDYTTLSKQVDYLAAYFAELENHVNNNFSGDEKEAQLKIITETVGKSIKDVSEKYAENVGGALESLGQSGERDKIQKSVLNLINERINSYREIIKENPDFAGLKGTEDEWLTGSHRFMASELQKAYAASGKIEKTDGYYSENDLLFMGKITSSLPTELNGVRRIADEETIGFALGTVMAKTLELGKAMGVGNNALGTVKGAVSSFQQNFMELVNKEMAERRAHAINSREREGYDPLDKQAVMSIAMKMQVEYENTQNLMKALFKGIGEGFKNHMEKVTSGSHDKELRYNENNRHFWHNMYSDLSGKESTSMKIERDAFIYEVGLDKKNLGVDMGFSDLHVGYFTYEEYNAPLAGKIISELAGIN